MTRDELIAKIEKATDSDKDFQEIIAAILDNRFVTEEDIRRGFDCSVPTVQRWKSGDSAPYYLMRKAVFDWLKEKLQAT